MLTNRWLRAICWHLVWRPVRCKDAKYEGKPMKVCAVCWQIAKEDK